LLALLLSIGSEYAFTNHDRTHVIKANDFPDVSPCAEIHLPDAVENDWEILKLIPLPEEIVIDETCHDWLCAKKVIGKS